MLKVVGEAKSKLGGLNQMLKSRVALNRIFKMVGAVRSDAESRWGGGAKSDLKSGGSD